MRFDEARARVQAPPLTVLQVTPELDAGGVERTTIDIAAAIAVRGGRALVASRGGRLEGELTQAGGALIRMPVHAKDPIRIGLNAARLASVIRGRDVDIVHARSRAPAWSALWAARGCGAVFVTTYHGTYTARSGLKRWYNSVMARGDRVIANSEFIRARIVAEHGLDGARIPVIPRGADLAALDPASVDPARVAALRQAFDISAAEQRPVALLPGRLTRWKGQSVAIRALAKLVGDADRRAPVILVLAGDDQGRAGYREELQTLARDAGVADVVRIPGHCADMPAAYALADIVISASTEPEAFGRVAVEAQCMGRPVIATDHGGARETVVDGETGVLVAPDDADALAAALGRLLAASPAERLELGERAAKRARRLYSVQAMQAATIAVYEDALERRER